MHCRQNAGILPFMASSEICLGLEVRADSSSLCKWNSANEYALTIDVNQDQIPETETQPPRPSPNSQDQDCDLTFDLETKTKSL